MGVGQIQITDVQVYGGYILHKGKVVKGEVNVGSEVNCKVNYERRRLIAPNHSMTHVLNAALREVLGDDVDQRGSSCNDEKLRFDFNYKKALKAKQLKKVEKFCQDSVEIGKPVSSQVLPLKDAQELNGVRAVFGEVYPDPVRVISIGDDTSQTSIEFCGGTHLQNLAEAEAFVLIEETAVAKGIRRITAVTGETARKAVIDGERFHDLVTTLENE